MEFRWEKTETEWRLMPTAGETSIVVRPDGQFWSIYVNECRLMPGNYTGEQGAKLDAWQFAYSKRKALFGAYQIRLQNS